MARKSREEIYGEMYDSNDRELHALLSKTPIALTELIEGLWREEPLGNGGTIRIYREKPSIEAIKLLLERTRGKVTTRVEVESTITTNNIDLSNYSRDDVGKLLELATNVWNGDIGGSQDGKDVD